MRSIIFKNHWKFHTYSNSIIIIGLYFSRDWINVTIFNFGIEIRFNIK